MGSTLTVRHRPSNGMLVFTASACLLGLWLICWPGPVRSHDAMDWLEPINLRAMGCALIVVALCRLVADAMARLHALVALSAVLCAFHLTVCTGIMLYDPSWSAVLWLQGTAIEALLASRRI